uniref:uncharacterized protein LOC117160604 n=1 Tax=Bombus vancouverensis nearcticus TaxID=2705178 RepID=UPI00143B68D1|nr:uncharacterized protein LOC117160604 [Bombus vancouverensis nearcticus]
MSLIQMEDNDSKTYTQSVQRRLESMVQYRNDNWKMSYGFINTTQKNVVLQQKSTYLLCTYKNRLQNACPADIKLLKRNVQEDLKSKYDELKSKDVDFEECETDLDIHASELAIDPPKVKIWNEYRKLLELSRQRPKSKLKQSLIHVTSLPKLYVNKSYSKLRSDLSTRVKRSILRSDTQKSILVANTNYVQFRNFKLRKMYKKIIILQNVSNIPARFQIEGRPYRSKFRVIVQPVVENRGIVPPGMQLRLIILFRCDDIDTPEEVLVLNVQHGSSVIIRLHGYKDPPILLGIKITTKSFTLNSSGTLSTWMTEDDNFVSMTFDCKKAFVGEEAYVLIKFKNVGGEGRFFIMSEADWFSMNIIDITDKNSLKLSCFTVWPAYFALNTNEELDFRMYFSPECYGIHVEKLYILCDNCTLLETEIIGDGLIYESNFIQLSKHLMKLTPLERNIDNQANYYINLSTNTPDGIGQCIIAVSNISEISMHFSWMKRNVQTDMHRIHTKNYFPLELLHINPDQGVFAPTSVHYFTVTAEYKDLQPNYYFAVLQ